MIFSLASAAVDILIKLTSVPLFQIIDDEAGIRTSPAGFNAGYDPLNTAPAFSPIIKFLVAASLGNDAALPIKACAGSHIKICGIR